MFCIDPEPFIFFLPSPPSMAEAAPNNRRRIRHARLRRTSACSPPPSNPSWVAFSRPPSTSSPPSLHSAIEAVEVFVGGGFGVVVVHGSDLLSRGEDTVVSGTAAAAETGGGGGHCLRHSYRAIIDLPFLDLLLYQIWGFWFRSGENPNRESFSVRHLCFSLSLPRQLLG